MHGASIDRKFSFVVQRQDPLQKRGRGFRCNECGDEKPKAPLMFHILKVHREVAEVPFYCSLCGFKAFRREQLERHVQSFPLHLKIKGVQNTCRPDSDFFIENKYPREIEAGRDFIELPSEESRDLWSSRQRKKAPSVASTVTVVRSAIATATSPVEPVMDKPAPNLTPVADSTVTLAALLKNLHGKVDPDILEQAMSQSGVPCSPTFSQSREPLFEIEDPLDSIPVNNPVNNQESTSQLPPSDLQTRIAVVEQMEAETLQSVKSLLACQESAGPRPEVTSGPEVPVLSTAIPVPERLSNLVEVPASLPTSLPESTVSSTPVPSLAEYSTATSTLAEYATSSTLRLPVQASTIPVPVRVFSTCDKGTEAEGPSMVAASTCTTSSQADAACQTSSLADIVKPIVKEMWLEGMSVFACAMGQKLREFAPAAEMQGMKHSLDVTNQNLAQLAQCIEAQNRITQEERARFSDGVFADSIKTLNHSINDLRADFRSYQSRPASESQHSRTAAALDSVVAGINVVVQSVQRKQAPQQVVSLSNYEQKEFNQLFDEHFHNAAQEPPRVKSIEDRRRERIQQKVLKSTENQLEDNSKKTEKRSEEQKKTEKKTEEPKKKSEKTGEEQKKTEKKTDEHKKKSEKKGDEQKKKNEKAEEQKKDVKKGDDAKENSAKKAVKRKAKADVVGEPKRGKFVVEL